MNLTTALHALASDEKLKIVLSLIALDVVLGVSAAARQASFSLARLADFARVDLLGKVLPWASVYVMAKLAPSTDYWGLGLDTIADGLWVLVGAALLGSLASSVYDLSGYKLPLPAFLAIGEDPHSAAPARLTAAPATAEARPRRRRAAARS